MSKKIKLILMTIISIGLILVNVNTYAKTGKLINDTTRVRKEASTESDIVALASVGETVEILSEEGEWYKVNYSDKTGYIRKDMLEITEDTSLKKENTTENNTTTENVSGENTTNKNEITENTTEENTIAENTTIENTTIQNVTSDNTSKENNTSENSTSTINTTDEVSNESDNKSENDDSIKIGDKVKLSTNLEIKILPLINSSVIAKIDENTEISIIDIINKWCYIETDNASGWTLISKVKTKKEDQADTTTEEVIGEEQTSPEEDKVEEENTPLEEEKSENETVTKYVSTETLNVRENAQNDSKVIKQLKLNTEVIVNEQVDSTWSKITVKGVTGYVASKYLSDKKSEISSRSLKQDRTDTVKQIEEVEKEENNEEVDNTDDTQISTETEQTSNSSQSTGAEIVEFAKKYLGYNYVSGGASPSVGFDCSGFVFYVYKNFGITLNRTSASQASNGIAVSKPDLQLGDIVLFKNGSSSKIGHVGIYIGGNMFIHAANGSKGVVTTSLSNSYYLARYVTARRIIN